MTKSLTFCQEALPSGLLLLYGIEHNMSKHWYHTFAKTSFRNGDI
jgi:hypothetical protein